MRTCCIHFLLVLQHMHVDFVLRYRDQTHFIEKALRNKLNIWWAAVNTHIKHMCGTVNGVNGVLFIFISSKSLTDDFIWIFIWTEQLGKNGEERGNDEPPYIVGNFTRWEMITYPNEVQVLKPVPIEMLKLWKIVHLLLNNWDVSWFHWLNCDEFVD